MDIFNIYLPIAGIEFNALLLVLIGFCVGVLGGFFGVGGGWIVTPALNIFGFHMAFAIGKYMLKTSIYFTLRDSVKDQVPDFFLTGPSYPGARVYI